MATNRWPTFTVILTIWLATPAFVGCLAGTGNAPATAWSAGASPGDDPALPSGLAMDGAEVVEYTDRAVVWRWEATTGPGVARLPGQTAEVSTAFDVPAGIGLTLEANLTWRNDDLTDIGVRVEDADGRTVCTGGPPASVAYPSTAPSSACASWEEALPSAQRWIVSAQTYAADQVETPFTVELRVEARPSSQLAEVAEMRPFETTAEDGTTLRGHVYLPHGGGPFATVLELSGYWNTFFNGALGLSTTDGMTTREGDRTTLEGFHGWFLDAGFAVALVNIRGTGISDGCQDYAGKLDVSDAGLVIQTLAAQPWSNGNVGMFGASWPGTSVYTGVASGAPALKAAVPASATLDWWHDETEHGALSGTPGQAVVYEGLGMGPAPIPDPNHDACGDHPSDLVENLRLVENGDRTGWWEERNLRRGLENASAAIFATYGMANAEWVPLRDPGFWDRIPHEDKSLLLGQWRHQEPPRADYWPDVLAWFDHHLRDGPPPTHRGTVRYQDSAGTWHRADGWPPPGQQVRLLLSDGELVPSQNPTKDSEARFPSSNRRALPDTCPESRLFISEPLAEDVVLAGVFRANLTISSTLPDGNFAANLWHVDEPWACGQAPGVQGATSGSFLGPNPGLQRFEVGFSLTDLYHRGHLDVGKDFPTQRPAVMRMTSESFATFVPAGERLVLALGGGDPVLVHDPRNPLLTVHTGPDVEGELVVNVVEGTLAFAAKSAPDGRLVAGVAS